MALPRLLLAALAAAAAGCATGSSHGNAKPLPPPARESRAGTRQPGAGPAASPPAAPHAQARRAPDATRRAVETAGSLVGQKEIVVGGVSYGDGCAALVRAAFGEAGAPLPQVASVADLHALARERGALRRSAPAVGDVVFMADRPSGPAEHAGLVERIGPDGTATVLHRTSRGVIRLHLNLAQPWKARGDDGKILNDVLLVGGGRVPAGRLVVAFATLL